MKSGTWDIDFRRVASTRLPRDFAGWAEPKCLVFRPCFFMHAQTVRSLRAGPHESEVLRVDYVLWEWQFKSHRE